MTFTSSLNSLISSTASLSIASSSRISLTSVLRKTPYSLTKNNNINATQFLPIYNPVRFAGEIVAPRKLKWRKHFKGRIPIPIGGSKAGTKLEYGEYGIRTREGSRLSAQQLEAARRVIRRKLRAAKGSEMWLRVFPDIPVSSKGNETRMGKGKGTLDHYACRVPMGRVVFEIGGGDLRWELAQETLRQAGMKLPVAFDIIRRNPGALNKSIAKAETTEQNQQD
ncbi:ribosomal protein L10e/L16 [Paraphysoderma sedebokerense]|nr:ribosomal protein L10e/L16 [Paraphysoderma sedebokerense]